MKPQLIFFFVTVCSFFNHAQDTLWFRNDQVVVGKVIEITPKVIKYTKAGNKDGPVFVNITSELLRIHFEKGEWQYFPEKTKQTDHGLYTANGFQKIIMVSNALYYNNRALGQTKLAELIDQYPDADKKRLLKKELQIMLRYKKRQYYWGTAGPIVAGAFAIAGFSYAAETSMVAYAAVGGAIGIGILITSINEAKMIKRVRLEHTAKIVELYNSEEAL